MAEYPSVEELRRWSAEFVGFTPSSPTEAALNKSTNHYWITEYGEVRVICREKSGWWLLWEPDSENSPAWQILAVIEKMKEKGHTFFSNQCGDRWLVYFDNSDGEILQGPSGKAIDKSFLIATLMAARAAMPETQNAPQ